MLIRNCTEVLTLAYLLIVNGKSYIVEVAGFDLKDTGYVMIKVKISSENSMLIYLEDGCYMADIPFTHKSIREYFESNILNTETFEKSLESFDYVVS